MLVIHECFRALEWLTLVHWQDEVCGKWDLFITDASGNHLIEGLNEN